MSLAQMQVKTQRRILKVGALVLGVSGAFAAGYALAAEPHMTNALGALQQARNELQMAIPNKGGHRERAINLVNQAIQQVEAGIGFSGG